MLIDVISTNKQKLYMEAFSQIDRWQNRQKLKYCDVSAFGEGQPSTKLGIGHCPTSTENRSYPQKEIILWCKNNPFVWSSATSLIWSWLHHSVGYNFSYFLFYLNLSHKFIYLSKQSSNILYTPEMISMKLKMNALYNDVSLNVPCYTFGRNSYVFPNLAYSHIISYF